MPEGQDHEITSEHLRVHPSVIFKLGEDLITDEIQALAELIKNCYDADSPIARVEVDTHSRFTSPVAEDDEPLRGLIVIQDRGTGMTREELVDGWLTVSNSWKKIYKADKEKLPPGRSKPQRTPLGDKGLGRLGAQRLGDVLEVETRSKFHRDQAWHVVIPWRSYDTATSLDDVPIAIEPLGRAHANAGTTLKIFGLRPSLLDDVDSRNELQRKLATLISPFGRQRGFKIEIVINGTRLDLYEVTRQVRSASEVSYHFEYNAGTLNIHSVINKDFFKPNTQKDMPQFTRLMEADRGRRFSDWLYSNRSAAIKRFGIARDSYPLLFRAESEIDVLERSQDLVFEEKHLVDPGPFVGEVDAVDLQSDQPSTFDTRAEYREFVEAIHGIKIYRNGFGIRTGDEDWLALGRRWSTGKSYYSLRPNNVIGYVDITVEDNSQLEEVTDREGFRDTPAYKNFYGILQIWLDYTADLQTMLRRAWNEYLQSTTEDVSDFGPSSTPEELLRRMDRTIRGVGNTRAPLRQAQGDLERLRTKVGRVANHESADVARAEGIEETASEIQAAADRVAAVMLEVEAVLSHLEDDRVALRLIGEQVEVLRGQLSDAWATVALGITAEALTHEMLVIADKLRGNTRSLERYLNSRQIDDQEIRLYVEHVRSSVSALSKQLDHLNPGLSYVRDRRDRFVVGDVLADISSFYRDRFAEIGLEIDLKVIDDFRVFMSRGRFTQVMDNLILNSEYWIRQLQKRVTFRGVITITCIRPRVLVSDNGPGISLSVEDTLFEPFVTTKPRERRGRGLGLFVARQLLDTDGGTIALATDRDTDGRRRTFEIGLDAAAREAR